MPRRDSGPCHSSLLSNLPQHPIRPCACTCCPSKPSPPPCTVVPCRCRSRSAFPVDTHIHRLAQRWGLTAGRSVEQTEADLKLVFPEHLWRDLHLQIIFLGREHCPARGHDPAACAVCSWAAVPPYDRCERPGGQAGCPMRAGSGGQAAPALASAGGWPLRA
jgi:hypothetical protein